MPAVQWFPGHMHAAKKKIAAALKNTDLVLELLDARCPLASQNPMIVELLKTRQKPSLKLLNKSDLADPAQNQQWQAFFNAQANTKALIINALNPKDIRRVLKTAQELAPHRGSALKPLRLMVLGIPNVGKSTFLNGVSQKKITQTGDVPALTKAIQRIDVSKTLILFDTPGLMWPKIENAENGLRLSAINAIGVNAFDVFETALFLAHFLKTHYPELLSARYDFPADFLDSLNSADSSKVLNFDDSEDSATSGLGDSANAFTPADSSDSENSANAFNSTDSSDSATFPPAQNLGDSADSGDSPNAFNSTDFCDSDDSSKVSNVGDSADSDDSLDSGYSATFPPAQNLGDSTDLADSENFSDSASLGNSVDFGDSGDSADSVKILAEIAKRRGAKLKGGDWDLEKSAHILLTDFRTTALGKISLEWAN